MSEDDKVSGAEDKKVSGSTVAIVGSITFGAALLGLGLWKLSSYLQQREEFKRELIQEYITELEELMDLQEAIANKGEPISDLDQQRLDAMTDAMAWKEKTIESYDTNWVIDLVREIERLGQTIGIWFILIPIAGFIVGMVLRELFRRRPPKPPQFKCQKDGQVFPDEASLEAHISTHEVNPDPQVVLSAQALFAQQRIYVRSIVAVESGAYRRAGQPWTTLTPAQITMIAYGVCFVIAVGAASAGTLGPIAVLLLL